MLHIKKAFTLLEIIIVIIIIGVLASLALPRLFKVIEYSRSAEAFATIMTIRSAAERCYLMNNGRYTFCTSWTDLNLEDPKNAPNAHFEYFPTTSMGGQIYYGIAATRNTNDGGKPSDRIFMGWFTNNFSGGVLRCGEGVFLPIGKCPEGMGIPWSSP